MDITTILCQPPLSIIPSLEAGDRVRDALTTLATQLKRIEKIPEIEHPHTPPPRVETPTISKQIDHPPALPKMCLQIKPTSSPLLPVSPGKITLPTEVLL